MKTIATTLMKKLSPEQLAKLTSETKETIALGIALENQPVFTAANLWNIHRHARGFTGRRFL